MRELFIGFIFIALGTTSNAFASDSECTEWVKERSVSCIHAGSDGDVYKRKCENFCWYNWRTRRGNMGPDCNRQRVCSPSNPANFTSTCSAWEKQRGVTCHNRDNDDWEQKWVRVCTKGYDESRCSDSRPTL